MHGFSNGLGSNPTRVRCNFMFSFVKSFALCSHLYIIIPFHDQCYFERSFDCFLCARVALSGSLAWHVRAMSRREPLLFCWRHMFVFIISVGWLASSAGGRGGHEEGRHRARFARGRPVIRRRRGSNEMRVPSIFQLFISSLKCWQSKNKKNTDCQYALV